MRKALILVWLCYLSGFAYGQEVTKAKMNEYKLDFAIPDIPAYKILGVESSNLMRPSNLEELTSIISQFTDGSSFIIPGSFGAEISPNLLLNRKLSLEEYNSKKEKFLKTLRISLASNRNGELNKVANIAMGIRFSAINEGDYRTDPKFQQEVDKVLANLVSFRQKLAEEFRNVFDVTPNELANSKELQDEESKYIDERVNDMSSTFIKNIIKNYEEKNWNARKLDFAFAINGAADDTLASNLEFRNFAVWSTYANGIGNWGQYLLGVNYLYDDFLDNKSQLSLNARLYGGKNRIKGFIETQYVRGGVLDQSSFLFNTGFELNITGSLWTDINFGIESFNNDEEDGSDFKSDFNIKYRF